VDWNVAKGLRVFFNSDLGPYNSDKVETQGYKHQECEVRESSQKDQQVFDDKHQHKYTRVLGYATKDDAGCDGDDTVHVPVKRYPTPNVIQANASFPGDFESNPPEKVDVVFMDFIGPHVVQGLNNISGKDTYSTKDFKPYMGQEDTMTKLLLEYVGRYWRHDCV
jgi:hypothetical protein